jgi:heme oxygenase
MLRRLRLETRPHQCVADADALMLIARPPKPEAYREFLLKLYGFEAPFEDAFAAVTELAGWIDMSRRRKSALLVADLVQMGMSLERSLEIPFCRISRFETPQQALAWMYVVAKNVTTQQLLHGHLAQRAPELQLATSYLSAHDNLAVDPWIELGKALDHFAERPDDADSIVQAAFEAYDRQHDWLNPVAPSATAMRATYELADHVRHEASVALAHAERLLRRSG